MSTAPISSSSGFPPPTLPDDIPDAVGGDGGDAPAEGGDDTGTPAAPKSGPGYRDDGSRELRETTATLGRGFFGNSGSNDWTNPITLRGGQLPPPTPPPGTQPQNGQASPGQQPTAPRPQGDPAARPGQEGQNAPTLGNNTNPTGQNGTQPGMTGQQNGLGTGMPGTVMTTGTQGMTNGMTGNGIVGGTLNTVGNAIGSLGSGLLGSGGILAAPLSILSGGTFGGLGNVLSGAGAIPLAVGQAVGNAVSYVAGQAQSTPSTNANPNPNATASNNRGSPATPSTSSTTTHANTSPGQGTASSLNAPRTSTGPQSGNSASANANPMPAPPTQNTVARPATPGSVAEPAHPSAAASATRGSVTDLPQVAQPRGQGVATLDTHAATNANTGSNANAAARQAGLNAIQPLANQNNVLTLMVAPHAQLGSEDGSVTHTALFRGQGADGQENVRDILGRSYVFSADGRLVTRAQERLGIDAVEPSKTDAIDPDSVSNHGELSTHDLVWKVVAPAFVGMGALLGGATASVGIAAGSSGMGGTFMLFAAASILGYGAVRAISNLREIADQGASIKPLENPAARTHWVAAGSQSVGSLASLALLLI